MTIVYNKRLFFSGLTLYIYLPDYMVSVKIKLTFHCVRAIDSPTYYLEIYEIATAICRGNYPPHEYSYEFLRTRQRISIQDNDILVSFDVSYMMATFTDRRTEWQ